MRCYICDNPAIGQCQVCWKFYCASHGDVTCENCRRTQAASRFLMRPQSATAKPPDLPPGFLRADVLRGVLALSDVRHTERADLTLLSLESYEDGFTLYWRLSSVSPVPEPSARFGGVHPTLLFAPVKDDLGTEYHGGIGGGGGSDRDWRAEARFSPAIAAGATWLNIRIEEIQWMSWMPGVRSRSEIGPWDFQVSLAEMKTVMA